MMNQKLKLTNVMTPKTTKTPTNVGQTKINSITDTCGGCL